MKRVAMLLAAVLVASVSTDVLADCRCSCVNGQIEAVCRLPSDLPPVCAPRACTVKPAAGLINSSRSGVVTSTTKQCREVPVLNPQTGTYLLKTVCQQFAAK